MEFSFEHKTLTFTLLIADNQGCKSRIVYSLAPFDDQQIKFLFKVKTITFAL